MQAKLFLSRPTDYKQGAFLAGLNRNLIRLFRNKASLVSLFIIPGVLLSGLMAVFGHAAQEMGFDYSLYLMAGAMFQAVMFSAGGSVMAMAVDLENGLLDRSMTMPVSVATVLASRLACDLIRSTLSVATVIALGYLWGARPPSLIGLCLAFALSLLIGLVLSLVFMALSLPHRRPIQIAGIIQGVEMLFLMASTAFIPVITLPKYFSDFVYHQPFSPLIDSLRALLRGQTPGERGWVGLAWLLAGSFISYLVLARSLRRRKA